MPRDIRSAKLLARIMAAQAVYSWEASGAKEPWTKEDITPDMASFYREQAGHESGTSAKVKEDRKLFREIAVGAIGEHETLDAVISPYLGRDGTIKNLPMAVRAILRAAVYEVRHMDTPAGVAIREYATVTEVLSGDEEVAFVHAVLDRVAKHAEPTPRAAVDPGFPDLSGMTAETLSLMLTRDMAWILKAQKLRHKVFFEEEGATNSGLHEGIDEDKFDAVCDHLLVLDTQPGKEPEVVGTYRLLRSNTELKFDHYYTQTEFDISKILAKEGVKLELGRSCIATEYRNGAVIQLLWRAIGTYLVHFKIDYMFGCASFHGVDPMEFQQGLSYLHHKHLAPEELRTAPMPAWKGEVAILPAEQVDRKVAQEQLPPLLKGYMRLGAYVGEGVVVDKDFHSVDVCIILDSQQIPRRYKEHFLDEAQQAAFPGKKPDMKQGG